MKDTTNNTVEYALRIKPLTVAESMRQNRIFISHKTEDSARTERMDRKMRERGLEPIWDKAIVGGDFKKKIERMLRCRAAVILVSEAALSAPWVEYELGFLEGCGIPIFLWDPDEVLSKEREGGGARLSSLLKNVQLFRHMPAITGETRLIDQLLDCRMYADLRRTELPDPTMEPGEFDRRFGERVETVAFKLACPRFAGRSELLRHCRLGTLLVHFGCFSEEGVTCCPVLGANASFAAEELASEQPVCRKRGEIACARYGIRRALDADNAECLLLNHIEWSGRFEEEKEPLFSFYVPIHSRFGTTFKLVIDPPDEQTHWELVSLLERSGLSPSVSDSRNSLRIYLSLQEEARRGLFCLGNKYHDNFCCPAALSVGRK